MAIILEPIEPYYAGQYRLEYDGKYITLFGCDNRYEVPFYGPAKDEDNYPVSYEEMVLVSVVAEIRNASPYIHHVDETTIYIETGV